MEAQEFKRVRGRNTRATIIPSHRTIESPISLQKCINQLLIPDKNLNLTLDS
jgi:hypothetical protein